MLLFGGIFNRSGSMNNTVEHAKAIIRKHGGIIRTSDAISRGIHPRTLYRLRDEGEVEQLARGLFRLSSLQPVGDPDLAIVAGKVPEGVVCLLSSLAIHELTTQIPHTVHLAISRSARYPVLDYPPIKVYRFSKESFSSGIEKHDIGGAVIRVYNVEKTIADCFKYRNKLGLDLALEALRNYRRKPGAQFQRILEYSRINRVDKIIRPYLEALQ